MYGMIGITKRAESYCFPPFLWFDYTGLEVVVNTESDVVAVKVETPCVSFASMVVLCLLPSEETNVSDEAELVKFQFNTRLQSD